MYGIIAYIPLMIILFFCGEKKEEPKTPPNRVNELFGVRHGQWKMYFPHTFRTMSELEPDKNDPPGDYKM